MDIAIVAPEDLPIPPRQGGSVQIYLHALCRVLNSHKHVDLTLLCPPGGGRRPEGLHQIRLLGGIRLYRTRAIQYLQRLQPDIVQIDNRPSLVPLVRRALPHARISLNLHSTTFLGPQHIQPKFVKPVLMSSHLVIVNSHYLKRVIAQRFSLKDMDWNVHVIHPGTELSRFQPLREHWTRNEDDAFHVIYVGRVIRQKGVEVLVSSIRHLHRRGLPVRLTIVGQTPPWEKAYGEHLRKSNRGLPIRWLGFVPPNKLPRLLWTSDVLVCPSQRNEAFGMVNVEAMAAGLPVIASRQGGIPEIVDRSCGILVEKYKHPRAFADAIHGLMADPKRWEKLHQGAKKRAAQFTWEKTARQFIHLYTTAL